jgi:hypothetical protein
MHMGAMGRRRFMRMAAGSSLGLTGWLSQGCVGGRGELADAPAGTPLLGTSGGSDQASIFVPKVNGGINLQPVRRLDKDRDDGALVIVPELVALQLRTVYELGFDGIRLTVPYGDRANFLGSIPYVRAARALGIDAVVVLSNFSGLVMARVLFDDKTRPEVLKLYNELLATPPAPAAAGAGGLGPRGVGRIAFQILNEPALFFGIPPDVYVHELLGPCHAELRELNPQIIVVAAAEVGTLDGPPRMRAMFEAGLENACDRVAFHIYDREVIEALAPNVRGLVWVTESGAAGTDRHLGWVRDTDQEIRTRLPDVSRIFHFDLYDSDRGKFRLIDLEPQGSTFRAVAESADLYSYFARNVAQAAAGRPLLPFETLVPDIRAYFPTAADVQAYDSVYFA